MPQLVPAALVAPTRPGLTDVGYLVRSASSYSTILTNWTAVAEAGSSTGYYPVLSTISVPDAGCIIEWRRASNSGTFLSAVTVDPVPSNFTDMAITASTGQVTVGTLANNSITAAVIATDAIDDDAIAASAVTEVQAGLATQASVNAIPTTPAPTAAQNAAATWTYTTGDRLLTGSQATEIAKIQGIRDKTDALPSDPADQSLLIDAINTRASQTSVNAIPTTPLLAANYTAPDNSGIAAIKAKTDNLPSDPADQSELVTLINTRASQTSVDAIPTTAAPTAAQNASQVRTELGTELARIDTSISSRSTLTAAQIRAELATELARLDVAVSTRLATAGYTTPPTTAQIATAVEAALLNDADGQALLAAIQTAVQALFDQQADIPVATLVSLIAAQITTDHGAGSYVAPNISALALEASVQAIKAKTDAIPANPLLTTDTRLNNLDTTVSSRASQTSVNAIPTTPLLAANYTAPDNAGVAAIKAKTDNLPSDPADQSELVTLINTRASQASVNAIPTTPAPTAAQNASQVRTELGTELARLDVAVSSRSTLTAGDIPAGLTAQQVWTYTGGDRSLSGAQAATVATTLATTQAVAKGQFVIDYDASTATQYNTDGTVLQVFDLQDKDGNPATSAQTAVKRVPR